MATRDPADIRRRALEDDLIRGDLVSEDGSTTAIIVGFDEDRIDEVRAGVIQQIHDIVDPKLPAGVRAYYNGSLEISETYNRITLDNQRKFTPPILLFTVLAIYFSFRSWRKTLLAMFAILISLLWTLGLYSLMGYSYNVLASMLVPLVVVLAIADDVHIMQHWDEERRHGDAEQAFKATVAHLLAPLFGASATTALGMLSLATSSVVAVQGVRRRIGGRDHGGFRDLDRPDADAAVAREARDGRSARTSATFWRRSRPSRGSRARTRGACSRSRWSSR